VVVLRSQTLSLFSIGREGKSLAHLFCSECTQILVQDNCCGQGSINNESHYKHVVIFLLLQWLQQFHFYLCKRFRHNSQYNLRLFRFQLTESHSCIVCCYLAPRSGCTQNKTLYASGPDPAPIQKRERLRLRGTICMEQPLVGCQTGCSTEHTLTQ